MTADMDLGGNRKMDWFFNQYVYGTDYPSYKFTHSFSTNTDGDLVLNFTLAQSDVGSNLVMLVPVYLDFGDGKFFRLGSASMKGPQSIEQHVPLKGLKVKPKRAVVAYFDDLMANVDNK